jgi:hypothetical protein
MSKRSKKNYYLEFNVEQLQGCCGMGELCNFEWYADSETVDIWGTTTRCIIDVDDYKAIKRELKKATLELRKGYLCGICTVTDDSKLCRKMLKALKELGWREDRKCKSNHGKYYIHLLSIKFRTKKK